MVGGGVGCYCRRYTYVCVRWKGGVRGMGWDEELPLYITTEGKPNLDFTWVKTPTTDEGEEKSATMCNWCLTYCSAGGLRDASATL